MSILVTKSSMPPIEEYMEEIKPIFESRWMTNMGPVYKKFQHQLKDYLGVPEMSLFVNGAGEVIGKTRKKPGKSRLLAA